MREQATNEVARQFTEQDGIGSIVEAIVAVLLFFLQIPQRQMQVEAVSGKLLDIGLGCEAGDETMPRRDGPRRLAQEAHIISGLEQVGGRKGDLYLSWPVFALHQARRSEEHTSELQSHRDLHSFPTRRSSDLSSRARGTHYQRPGAGRWAQGRSLSVLARIRSAPGA